MSRVQGRREVTDLLARHGITPRKALGQHFVADPNIVRKLVRLARVGPGDEVLEVGAGTGTLTMALAEAGCRVLAYEVDRRLEPLLTEVVADLPGVELRFADAMQVDFAGVLAHPGWTMCSNLPYNVGTPLLLGLLREVPHIGRYVVMVQREVAERLVAVPGSKDYGVPSVVAQLFSTVEIAFRVPPQVFVPPPEVESAVVLLERLGERLPPQAGRAADLASAAFRQRRKMLRGSLAAVVPDPGGLLAAAGIAEERRSDDLAPDEYLALAAAEERRG